METKLIMDNIYVRIRESIGEFRNVLKSVKVFRDIFKPFVGSGADQDLISRVVQVLADIKNLYATSVLGCRKVLIGLKTLEAKKI